MLHKVPATLVVLVLGAGIAAQQGWIPTYDASNARAAPARTPPVSEPGLSLDAPPSAGPVLPAVHGSSRLSASGLQRLLGPEVKDSDLGKHLALVIERLGADRTLLARAGHDLVKPASTLKLVTTAAALRSLGTDHRFETTVVTGGRRGSVVLVGGGDPLLTGTTPSRADAQTTYPQPASLEVLANRAAASLAAKGTRRVTMTYDESLFSRPRVNPQWKHSYVADDVVSPITSLWVDEGRKTRGLAARVDDPAAVAATRFAVLLTRAGVAVKGNVEPGRAPADAETVALVRSPPLAAVVQHVLEVSDNEAAEVLLRQVAIADGRPGSFEAGVAAVRRELDALGIDMASAQFFDGSGLSRHDRVPIEMLADVLQLAASQAHPELRPVIGALPVAGFNGSLASRFVQDGQAGLGVVRAKTGMLSGVHGLAGIVTTRAGVPLVFAVVADQVPVRKTLDARAQLDKIAGLLATCGC